MTVFCMKYFEFESLKLIATLRSIQICGKADSIDKEECLWTLELLKCKISLKMA